MDKHSYEEFANLLRGIVKKVKASNLEKGAYLEKHFVYNEINQTFEYTGTETVIKEIIGNSLVEDYLIKQ